MRVAVLPALFAFCLSCAPSLVSAQAWETYENKDFAIQFQVPGKWKVETSTKNDVPMLEAESPDGSMYLFVYSYEDSSISTEELLDKAVDDLDFTVKGEAKQEDINGLDAWVAEATGRMDGLPVGLFIMAATYDDNNYVAYIFTEQKAFDRNAKVMNRILDSFKPFE